MYLNVDEKGRLLVPAAVRKRLGMGRRVRAEQSEEGLVVYASKDQLSVLKELAGSLKVKRALTAEELDDVVEEEMLKKFKRK